MVVRELSESSGRQPNQHQQNQRQQEVSSHLLAPDGNLRGDRRTGRFVQSHERQLIRILSPGTPTDFEVVSQSSDRNRRQLLYSLGSTACSGFVPVGNRRVGASDPRLLERRKDAGDDARRKECQRQRPHPFRKTAGRGVPTRVCQPQQRRPPRSRAGAFRARSVGPATPHGPTANFSTMRNWTDANRSFYPDCDLRNASAQDLRGSDVCGPYNNPSVATFSANTTVADPDFTNGWFKTTPTSPSPT